jgi:hypothetical protein
MMLLGTGATLWGAKLFAVACGAVLHRLGRHVVLCLLTILYVFAAIVPWSVILAR